MEMDTKERIVIALDFDSAAESLRLVERLRGRVGLFKVGSQLFAAEGPSVVEKIVDMGEEVFLDLKLHDIPNTVAKTATAAQAMGVSMLTVHASGGLPMMSAVTTALKSLPNKPKLPLVLAVTVLTSLGQSDLNQLGVTGNLTEQVVRLAHLATDAGLDGLVASPAEVSLVRHQFPALLLVTPGIRPLGSALNDQSRIATPRDALKAGANYLVIGRPITASPDPLRSLNWILKTI